MPQPNSKEQQPYTGFEQGPIRPPSEAESLLIRITRNCPWNRCTFCPVYKGAQFSRRPIDHVLRDIDTVRAHVDAILEKREHPNRSGANRLHRQIDDTTDQQALYAAHAFVAGGMRSVFLQDGNSLIIRPQDLIRILNRLREAFPGIERITSYARSQTLAKISDADLQRIAEAGLNRIHIGMESGSDTVLAMVHKGVDKATQVLAGQKVKKAGIQLSEYYMPGLGGRSLSRENALETADALNQINPDYIRLRTLALPQGAPLTSTYLQGQFDKMGDVETARELLLFLENLDGISSTIRSDHILNLLPEVDGILPEQRQQILAPVQEFLQLPPKEQLLFCIGRRTHRMARLRDLKDPALRGYAQKMCDEFGATVENMDQIIDTIIQRFI